ncbi:MAG: 2-oxoacid:acceptor oxidoreductase family protein [Mycoplasmatales bacterium]
MNSILPTGKESFYELRFHSIGGQGAYTTGQMVAAVAAEIDGLKAAIFASYGSEKKGAPVNVFVRFLESEKKITNFSAVRYPNVVAVFHEQLLKTQNVLKGLKEGGIVVVNTSLSAQDLVNEYQLDCDNIITVDATAIGVKTGAKINTIMYGAIMKQLGFMDHDAARGQIEAKLGYRFPHLVASNTEAFDLGYKEAKNHSVTAIKGRVFSGETVLGFNQQIPGGIILGANAQLVDRSISREGYLPGFEKDKCINCTKCDTTCPDDCFSWEEKEGRRGRMEMVLKGIDYNHCKGCLRCVVACPTGALTALVEERGYASKHTTK